MTMNNQKGLSLLEILMALVVVFLALMGFAGFSVVAHTGLASSEKMTRAVTLGQDALEDVRLKGIPRGITAEWEHVEDYGSIGGAVQHQRTLMIKPHPTIAGFYRVSVEVEWDKGKHAMTLVTSMTSP